jgi:STE24 endopeptidase
MVSAFFMNNSGWLIGFGEWGILCSMQTMKNIHPLLSRESQKKAKQYEKEKRFLGLASLAASLVFLLLFYFSGASSYLANLELGSSFIWTFLVYVAALSLSIAIFGFPLAFYSGFVHEHKWNFSNQRMKSWMWEQIKSFLVGLTIFILLLGLLLWIMAAAPDRWWLFAASAMALVSVIFAALFPVIIAPIFNKYTPIDNKELTKALEKVLSREGLKSSGFFQEDMSRQTKKENAFLAGLGRTRRVVLGDNLLLHMTVPQIESIIAHEVGHYRYRHLGKNILIGTTQQVVVFLILHVSLKALFPEFLTSSRWNLALVPIVAILLGVVSGILFGPLNNALSRSFEKQADQYALESIDDKRSFMTALAGLADRNLSNAYPEWWVKYLYYSHPPIGERLEMAEKFHP